MDQTGNHRVFKDLMIEAKDAHLKHGTMRRCIFAGQARKHKKTRDLTDLLAAAPLSEEGAAF